MKYEDIEKKLKNFSMRKRGHFLYNVISILATLLFIVLGTLLEYLYNPTLDRLILGYTLGACFAAIALLFLLPWWPMLLMIIAALWIGPALLGASIPVLSISISFGLLIGAGFIIVPEWTKVVILRFGRFHRVKGPGLMFLIPLIDRVAGIVDTRIRVSDFSAEKSLTRDTIPVHIDALAFWMVWDAKKAILEVQDYHEAVVLSAQTALRSCIGSNSLTALLSERERLGNEIQGIVDEKTNPWGITIISVEFKEIIIPKELEDVLSREAQAEREHRARNILSHTEAEIAALYAKASEHYKKNPTALQLRAMNMIYESIRNKGGLILTPASALENMNLGSVLGAAAYGNFKGLTPDVLPLEEERDSDEENSEEIAPEGQGGTE